jgi:hypothetical protein
VSKDPYRTIAITLAQNANKLERAIRENTASNPEAMAVLREVLQGAWEALGDEYHRETSADERKDWERGREQDEAIIAYAEAA